jgi:hypothetical protein
MTGKKSKKSSSVFSDASFGNLFICSPLVILFAVFQRLFIMAPTGFGLDGSGIEYRWGRDFLHTSRPALGPTQPPMEWVPGLSRG